MSLIDQGINSTACETFESHESQELSLTHVLGLSNKNLEENKKRIEKIVNKYDLELEEVFHRLQKLSDDARITINLHPDRLLTGGKMVMEGLLEEGRIKNQFETGISNGGLTAFKGGDRDKWEEKALGGSYQSEGVKTHHRPKYGALDLFRNDYGAAPRFGSSHFRLKLNTNERSTFSFGDTSASPSDFGVSSRMEAVWAAVVESMEGDMKEKGTLGVKSTGSARNFLEGRWKEFTVSPLLVLDEYIEVQIHSNITMNSVEAFVLDPSFKGTRIEELAEEMSKKYNFNLEYTHGFHLYPDSFGLLEEFRGEKIPSVAEYVLENYCNGKKFIDAHSIGVAAETVVNDSDPEWIKWGTKAECLQYLKQVWHSMVAFGRRGN